MTDRSASRPGARDAGPPLPRQDPGNVPLQPLFAAATDPLALLDAFAEGMATLPGELGDMGHRLRSAHADADWPRYGRALRQLIDKYIRTVEQQSPDGQPDSGRLRTQLQQVIGVTVAGLLQHDPELHGLALQQAAGWRQWRPGQPLDALEQGLRELGHQVGVRSDAWQARDALLLALFDLLLENVGELLDEGSWLQGQITTVRRLLAGPLDAAAVARAHGELRQVIYQQGLLKQGIAESKAAMRGLMGEFVQQLDGLASRTGEYHDRIGSHALALRQARSIADLGKLLQVMMQDTQRVQQQAAQARDHLASARRDVDVAEQRIARLEQELRQIADQVRTDPSTGALDRRGLDERLQAELERTARGGGALALAAIALDPAAMPPPAHRDDDALPRHFVARCRLLLRASDSVARLGREAFVLVMPDTPGADAMSTLQRLQHALAQRALAVQDPRVTVRFSAGLAQWRSGDTAGDLLQRAQGALQAAMQPGAPPLRAAGDQAPTAR